jgi:hypothetical protein
MEIMKIAEASERELHLLRRSLRPTDQFEMFIVHDHVWQKAGMGDRDGRLCIGCLEKRIGRRMTPADLPDHPFKALPGTPRLPERQRRHDPLGDFSG